MRTRFRSFIAATAVVAAAVTGGVVAAAPAGAAPTPKPVPSLPLYGDTIGVVGDHDFCRGAVTFRFTSPKRGVARLTLTSRGFTGDGAGWKKNPTCRSLFIATHVSATALNAETFIPVAFGARPGERVVKDIATGSGLVGFNVNPYALNTPVRVPQGGYGVTYLIVP